MKIRFGIAAALALLLLVPAAPARADVVLTPYVGSLFGGDLPDNRVSYGGSAAFMGGGIFGAEVGFNYTPTFVPETLISPEVSQASLMGNLIIGIPMGDADQGGQVRPYVTGGAGLFRATAKESDFFDRITSNDFAVNVGAGVMAFFSEHVGVRGDVRYFRTLTDDDPAGGVDFDLGDLDFWKWDVGAAFRF
jgi:Outer membrane protein beta-barrel domain